jgi:hypothetical protein
LKPFVIPFLSTVDRGVILANSVTLSASMSYSNVVSIAGLRGSFGVDVGSRGITFQQIFSGVPLYYPGSVIQVQEVAQIATAVYEPGVVDVDLTWWQPKKYLGSYQLTNGIYGRHRPGDDEYLVAEIQEISRYSSYTVTANPNTLIGLGEGFSILDCNWYTVPEVFLFPGTVTPVPGFRLRESPPEKPILRGYSSITPAPLANTEFNPLITDIGLHLKPGVEGIRVEYNVSIINDIYTAYSPYPTGTCELIAPTCSEQFSAFLSDSSGLVFADESTCLASLGGGDTVGICVLESWVCPSDPAQVFSYYRRQYGN